MGVHLLIGRLRLLVGGLVGLLVGLLLRLSLIGVVGLAGTIGPLRLSLVGVAGLLRGLVDVVRLRGLPLALSVVERLGRIGRGGRLGHVAEGVLLVSHERYLLYRKVMLPV